MVKKKTTGAEDSRGKNNNETFDNKDNKQTESEDHLNLPEPLDEDDSLKSGEGTELASEPEPDKVVSEEKAIEAKLAEMQDKYIRLSAEFDNYRKRTLKEKMDITKYASEELLKNLLPIMDDFERAMKFIEGSTDCKGIKEGIDLIYIKLSEFLKQNGITEIDAMNTAFSVDLHDAVAKIHVEEEDKKGKIVDVLSKGYYLKDKVIRHSKVVIGE